jgi:hypothetical protein
LQQLSFYRDRLSGIHLAGGEPFLEFERLKKIIKMAVELGIPIDYVETNAFWCKDENTAFDKFSKLKEAGLNAVLISVSPFHVEWIPFSRIKRAIWSANEVFGPFNVVVYTDVFYRQLIKLGARERLSFNEYLKIIGKEESAYLIKHGYSLIPGGRAPYGLGNLFDKYAPSHFFGQNCRYNLESPEHIHIDLWGNYITGFCAGLSVGSGFDLKGLFRGVDLSKRPILKLLVEEGVEGLFRFAKKEFDYKELKEGYISKCHLCVDIRRHIVKKTDEFEELTPSEYYQNLEIFYCMD